MGRLIMYVTCLLALIACPFVRAYDYIGALFHSRRYIRREFVWALVLLRSRTTLTCEDATKALLKLRCLPDLQGFDSVITLLRHRHRTRALARLEKLSSDWGTGRIGFKQSKPVLNLIPDESEETQA